MIKNIISIRKFLIVALLTVANFAFSQGITRIFTDFNNYWDSQINTTSPDTSHNLLGFTWKGNIYSTGVADNKLTVPGFSPQKFQAFPALTIPASNSGTYIGVANNYGGGPGNVSPIPVNNNLVSYLTDGTQGLDLGTAIFNLPSTTEITYQITNINPLSIGDNVPDIIFTQVGAIGNGSDRYQFFDNNNLPVGTPVDVNFSTSIPSPILPLGNAIYKFYSPANPIPTYQGQLQGPRPLRMMAFDWSDFGIDVNNAASIKFFYQKFSGSSDVAFTAYNTASMGVVQSISGSVFDDNNAGTPDGTGYSGATVRLYNSSNVLQNTVTTGTNGAYVFPNVLPGNYRIELQTPLGFTIVGATDNNTDNRINVTLNTVAIQNQNFGINRPPVANNDTKAGEKNKPIEINLATNDVDPNDGAVVPATINLIPLPGSTAISMDANNNVKSFTLIGTGTWTVDNLGLLRFTPVTEFIGNVPVVQYNILDTANLKSNNANIILTVYSYCTQVSTAGTGGNPTKIGITTQATKTSNWPESIPNGFIALESKDKGFVITRVQNSNLITDPKNGMLIYDINAKCVKLYSNAAWKCIAKACNE